MARFDYSLTARSALDGFDLSVGDNQIVERPDFALVSVAVPLGGRDALRSAFETGWGLTFPKARIASFSNEIWAISTTSDQIMMCFPATEPDPLPDIRNRLNGAGYITDQSDNWVILDVSGSHCLAALERICPLDLAQMPIHGSARTMMEHMSAIVLRLDATSFRLMSARSSAQSFLHAVQTSFENVVD